MFAQCAPLHACRSACSLPRRCARARAQRPSRGAPDAFTQRGGRREGVAGLAANCHRTLTTCGGGLAIHAHSSPHWLSRARAGAATRRQPLGCSAPARSAGAPAHPSASKRNLREFRAAGGPGRGRVQPHRAHAPPAARTWPRSGPSRGLGPRGPSRRGRLRRKRAWPPEGIGGIRSAHAQPILLPARIPRQAHLRQLPALPGIARGTHIRIAAPEQCECTRVRASIRSSPRPPRRMKQKFTGRKADSTAERCVRGWGSRVPG